jgi:hypothetical protein
MRRISAHQAAALANACIRVLQECNALNASIGLGTERSSVCPAKTRQSGPGSPPRCALCLPCASPVRCALWLLYVHASACAACIAMGVACMMLWVCCVHCNGCSLQWVQSVQSGTTICDTSRAYGNAAHAAVYLSLLIAFPTCSQHHLRIPAPISGNFYPKAYFPVMGGSSPLSLPISTSQAPSLEEHIAKGQEEKER